MTLDGEGKWVTRQEERETFLGIRNVNSCPDSSSFFSVAFGLEWWRIKLLPQHMLLYYYRNHSDHRTIIIVSVWPKPKQIWYGLGLGFIGVWSSNSGGRHQSIWFCSSPACLLIIWSWLNFRCNKMQRKLLPRWCCRQQKSGPYSKQEAAPYCGSVRAREDWFNLVSNFWTRLQRSVFNFYFYFFRKRILPFSGHIRHSDTG